MAGCRGWASWLAADVYKRRRWNIVLLHCLASIARKPTTLTALPSPARNTITTPAPAAIANAAWTMSAPY
jgi:hypothetical protein